MEDSHQNGKKICRLCLMKCNKYEVIERNIQNNMDVLLLNINVLLSEEPAICKNCAEIVKNSFDFKTMCLDTYKYIVSFIGDKSNIKIDLKTIYLNKKKYATGDLQHCNICGFCMGLVKSCFAISLDNQEDSMLQKMFDTCFPELDFSGVNKPIICAPCHGYLKQYFSFVTNCLFVEEEIRKYCETMGIENNETIIDLTDVLQFTFRYKVTGGEDVNTIDKNKKEKYGIHPDHFYEVGEYEIESVTEMKDQKFNNLLQFPLQNISLDIGKEGTNIEQEGKFCDGSENILDPEEIKCDLETFITIEDHKFDDILFSSRSVSEEVGVIKTEEKFVEEQIVQRNENYVGVEDQKYLLNEEVEIKTEPHYFSRFQSDLSKQVTSDDILKNQKYSELDHQISPSEILFHEFSREYRNDVEKHESITADPIGSILLRSECTNPSISPTLTPPKYHSEMSIYQCKSCSFETNHKRSLTTHLLQNCASVVKVHQCESCPFQTERIGTFKGHSFVHKDPSKVIMYQCDSCPYQTKCKNSLKKHSLVHKDPSNVTMYQCESCPFQTKRKGTIKKHSLVHKDPSKVTMYQCESCPFQAKRKDQLKSHLLIHQDPSNVTMYQCGSCPFQTKRKGTIKKHSLVHKDPSKVTMYQCDSCPYQTKCKEHLKKHSLVHKDPSKVTMYQCGSCPVQTKRKTDLKNHMLVHQNPSNVTMYQCGSCPFQTKRKGTIKNHSLVHKDPSTVTMYQCETCPFQTKRKYSLKSHLLVHKDTAEVTMYQCEFCSYLTKRKATFKDHLLIHKDPSNVTMYQCESCPFQTKRKRTFKNHSLVHKDPSNVTMYQCGSCPFQTKRKGTLKIHSLVHK